MSEQEEEESEEVSINPILILTIVNLILIVINQPYSHHPHPIRWRKTAKTGELCQA